MPLKLPKTMNTMKPDENFIMAYPYGYALRILEHYRKRCNERWITKGLKESEASLYDLMNGAQAARAEDLDSAIALLKLHPKQYPPDGVWDYKSIHYEDSDLDFSFQFCTESGELHIVSADNQTQAYEDYEASGCCNPKGSKDA